MKHLGDITKIDGGVIPPVDVVTGGSPCQDLSIAGKRAGLSGERSGLFMEQIRIIKEMRARDIASGRTGWMVRPRYMVWENVPGAFSSGNPKGADFAAVIEEIIKVAEPGASVSVCVPNGGWTKSGCYYAEDGSWIIAWRVHDAQFWGVPQRRKRIALVADFGGLSAPEILFERKGLRGDIEPSAEKRERTSRETSNRTGTSVARSLTHRYDGSPCAGLVENVLAFQERAGKDGGGKGVLCTEERVNVLTNHVQKVVSQNSPVEAAGFKAGQGSKANGIGWKEEVSPTISATASGTNQVPAVYDARGNGDRKTVCTITGDHQNRVTDYTALCIGNGQTNQSVDTVASVDCRNGTENPDVNGTIQANSNGGFSYNCQTVCRINQTVRRLTPLECERLQGFPDGWTDIGEWTDSKGKNHKPADSPRYKALGNSIALPFWQWMMKRIHAQYERTATLGSLFDGISGFPLVAKRCGMIPVWSSEIEEFPIAVCKAHFGDEDTGEEGDVWKYL